jgi:hypothetical protein
MPFDVFISYPHQEKTTADAACATLEAAGIRCWIAPRDVHPGMDWSECIIDAISACKVMVLIFSGHTNASQQIKREVERAVNRGVPIIPMRIENVLPSKSLEYFISTPHWLDAMTPPIERHLQALTASVKGLLDAKSPVVAEHRPQQPQIPKQIRPQSSRATSLLEWLPARGAPDSVRALILVVLAVLTLAPYLGGMTIWSIGSTPISLPTVPAAAFWPLVVLAPIWWCLIAARLIGAPAFRIASHLAVAAGLSILSVVFHTTYPGIALGSISPSFDQTHQFGFLETQHTWIASHQIDGKGERYCHFRTEPKSVGPAVRKGCVLRVDRLAFSAGGHAHIPDRSAFDIELYVGTSPMLPKATSCVARNDWPQVRQRPVGAEVEVRGVIEVTKAQLKPGGATNYSLEYDFESRKVTAGPALATGSVPNVSRADIAVKDTGAQFQISGWTLWGDPSYFELNPINLRISGRLFCGL